MIKNLILIIFILVSCAPDSLRRMKSIGTLPKIEGFILAGKFSMKNNIYAQHCDNAGNKLWIKYSEESKKWKRGKYETLGCVE